MTTLPPDFADEGRPAIEPKAPASSILTVERKPVTRWRRSVLVIGGTALATLFALGLVYAFRAPAKPQAQTTPAETKVDAQAQGPNGVTNRFNNGYADVPANAPGAGNQPVCGQDADAGAKASPMAAGSNATINTTCAQSTVSAPPSAVTPAQEAAEQRRQLAMQQVQAASSSGPFFGGQGAGTPTPGQVGPPMSPLALGPASPPVGDPAPIAADVGVQNGQGEKRQFADHARAQDYLPSPYLPPLSPYEVKAGAIIPAALITALNSDLPGEVIAQVSENVYDHRTGRYVLIPQGSRLIGQYDSEVAYGQERALVAWNRLIMPNGWSINIGSMTGADLSGASGLHDRVDGHIWQLVRGIALSTVVTIGAASAQDQQSRAAGGYVLNDATAGISSSANQAAQQFVTRDLNRQPTITVRPGWPVRILVNKDMVLTPYQP